MARYIALLRGINVGGNHKLPMADLRSHLRDDGFGEVTTYIQSGNLVLDVGSELAPDTATLAARLAESIGGHAGFEVPVVVRSLPEWSAMIAANPYPTDEPTHLHVLVPTHGHDTAPFESIDSGQFAPEAMTIGPDVVYLHLPDGMGRSKLAVAAGRVKVPTTARNWRTVLQLADLAER